MKYMNLRIPIPEVRKPLSLHALLPHPGNVLFTLLVVAGLLWANSVGALPLRAPAAASTSIGTIAYQGRLADAAGAPLTGTYNMIFRLYDVATGGTPLWTEQWTGSNGVRVSDGLFNVMLGSLTPIPQSVITGHDSLFLGITVGTDDEMQPRVQLGSVPFAVHSITTRASPRVITKTGTRDATTTSTSYEEVPEMSLSIRLEETRHLVVLFSGGVTNLSEVGDPVLLRLVVDGVAKSVVGPHIYQAAKSVPVILQWGETMPAGEHTIRVEWRVRAGTARFGSVQHQPFEQRVLTVMTFPVE
jgi:hypothetical protein